MSVDPYAMCPCGSGKKLKFCCSDLVADIEKIHRMVEGDQPRAALQHAEQTLKKRPGRPSLLDLKAMLELTLGKLDAAEATVAELLEKDPKNPAAHAQQAILCCARGDGQAGVEPLQRALMLVQENMPRRVLEAIGAVGHSLLMEGNVVAARAHLWLYQGIAGREDTRALELLVRLNQLASLPLLLRDHLYMHEAPEGHPAEDEHNYAQALAARGQWGPASAVFDKLCDEYGDVATLHYNRALVHGWLGDLETFSAGMREYALRDVPIEDAVEAYAIAQLVDLDIEEPSIDMVKLTYPILDEEEMVARLTRDPYFVSMPVDSSEQQEEEGPRPSAAYLLLDRPLPDTGEGLTRDTAPRIAGVVHQFGRQTNRAERLEMSLDRSEGFDDNRRLLEDRLQGVVGVAEEEVIGQVSTVELALSWRWHFPKDTPVTLRRQLTREETRRAFTQKWPALPLATLGGKTPAEAAADPAMRVPLLAAVLTLEQGGRSHLNDEAFAELRESLGLPATEPIDPVDVDAERIPLTRVTRIALAQASDEDLAKLYQRSAMAGASGAILHTGAEILNRLTMEQVVDIDQVLRRVISFQQDVSSAVRFLDLARDRSERLGKSTAPWDLIELEMCIYEGDSEAMGRMLQHIQSEHIEEPGVAEQLYELFYELGVIPENGGQPPPTQTAPAAQPSAIWTPESAQPAGAKQKLWTPS